jgi:heptosyltransferase-2
MATKKLRVLIVKILAIGDVVMSLPMLYALRKRHPEAHITWVCDRDIAPLLRETQQVDEIIEVHAPSLLRGSIFTKMKSLFQLWRRIGGKKFDLTMTLHADWRYRVLSLFIRCRVRKYFGKNKKRYYPSPGRYHALECLLLMQGEIGPVEVEVQYPSLAPPLPAEWRETLALLQERPLVILAPGGAKNALADDGLRRWPIEHYVSLAQKLLEQGVHVLVTGSLTDEWIAPYFSSLPILNSVGKLSLLDLVAVLQKASLLITHDSGPLHLAKLTACPSLALFGPTNPHEKMREEEHRKMIWGGERLSCRPCYNGKTYAKCHQNRCLGIISPAQVLRAAMHSLEKNEVFRC